MKPTSESLEVAKKIIQNNISEKMAQLKELNKNETLQRTIAEIISDRKLNDQKKQDLCNEIFGIYYKYHEM